MTKITELIRKYKKLKVPVFSQELYLLLNKIIKEKASFIFYNKTYGNSEFRLINTKKIEIEDIENELWIEILSIIKKYDIKKEFEPYLYATLWKWQPEIISKKEHRQVLYTKTETELKEEEKQQAEKSEIDEIQEEVDIVRLFKKLTESENKFLKLCIAFPDKNQAQLAKIMGVTRERVRQLVNAVKKKYKNNT